MIDLFGIAEPLSPFGADASAPAGGPGGIGSLDLFGVAEVFSPFLADVSAPAADAVTLRHAIHDKLSGLAPLVAVVGDSIFPGVFPQTWDYLIEDAGICWRVVDDEAGVNLDGPDGTSTADVEIEVRSSVKSTATALAGLIKGDWLDFTGTVAGVQVDAVNAGPREVHYIEGREVEDVFNPGYLMIILTYTVNYKTP